MSDTSDLAPLGGDALSVRESAATARAELTRKMSTAKAELAAARAELDRQRRAAEIEFKRQQGLLEAQMAPLRDQLSKLSEVLWSTDQRDRMVAAGRAVPGAIAVACTSSGQWRAYAPSPGAHDRNVYLDVTELHPNGTLGETTKWVHLPARSTGALTVAWSTPEWDTWNFAANPKHYLSEPDRKALIESLVSETPGLPLCVTEKFDPSDPSARTLMVWSWADGTPQETPLRCTNEPFDWRWEQGAGRLIPCVMHIVGNPSVRSKTIPFSLFVPGSSPLGCGIPWWPEDAKRYGPRPRLVWQDDQVMAEVADYVRRCQTLAAADEAQQKTLSDEAYQYVAVIADEIRQRQIAAARADFDIDYAGADDLWGAHLASLKLVDPIHPRTLWGIVKIALLHGESVSGRTLGDLAQSAYEHGNDARGEWHPKNGPQDMSGFEDLVVPELP